MTEPIILSVDLGTSSLKFALITVRGKVLGWETEPLGLILARDCGAQSDVWCQILADVMNVEIKQVDGPIYANARGAAWIAAMGLGEISVDDVPNLVEFKRAYSPNPNNRAMYDARFETFKQIYKQIKNVYRKLNG